MALPRCCKARSNGLSGSPAGASTEERSSWFPVPDGFSAPGRSIRRNRIMCRPTEKDEQEVACHSISKYRFQKPQLSSPMGDKVVFRHSPSVPVPVQPFAPDVRAISIFRRLGGVGQQGSGQGSGQKRKAAAVVDVNQSPRNPVPQPRQDALPRRSASAALSPSPDRGLWCRSPWRFPGIARNGRSAEARSASDKCDAMRLTGRFLVSQRHAERMREGRVDRGI
jgi:hypothetical protein